jgi:hypothetical protein
MNRKFEITNITESSRSNAKRARSGDQIKVTVENDLQECAVYASMRDMPKPYVITLGKPPRTPAQNRRYWGRGVLSQIAEQASINGNKFSAEAWHEQFKQMFIGVIELPNGRVVGKSSAELGTKAFSEFCTEVEAYAATELGVFFVDLHPMNEWSRPAHRVAALPDRRMEQNA